MKQLSNIRLLLVAICSVFMLGSCSDFPDELYFDGSINVEKGEVFYDAETNTYTQELIIDVNVTEASEDITHAYVFMAGKEIDFTNKINKRKGGKAKVRIDGLTVYNRYNPDIIVKSQNFGKSVGFRFDNSKESFCKISNFRITPKADPYEGADVSFRVEENPFVSNLPIKLKVGYNDFFTISDTSEKGEYHFNLENILFEQEYKCELLLNGYQVSDIVEYKTPKSKAIIEVEDVYVSSHYSNWNNQYNTKTYDLTAKVKDFDNIHGDKSFQLWKKDNMGKYVLSNEDKYDTGALYIRHTYYPNYSYWNESQTCEFRLYVDGIKWAAVRKSYYYDK